MIPLVPCANWEAGTAPGIRSLLHREMASKISPRSAPMAMAQL
jgi:hypothetical protein